MNSPFDGGGGGNSAAARCSNDGQCAPGACIGGICVPPAGSFSTPVAVEISPAVIGPETAHTEIAAMSNYGNWKLKTSASATVDAAFYVMNGDPFPSSANVVLEVPSLIAGRPVLSFEATIMPGQTTVAISVPAAAGTRAGSLGLIPLPPSDQTSPPYGFSVADAQGPFVLTLPTANQTPHGMLLDALGKPKTGYTVRAFMNGMLVSNVAAMKADGTFSLVVPADTGEVSIELAPGGNGDPWFIFNTMPLGEPNKNLGTITLPAYQVPQSVMFTVRGYDTGEPVGGAALRAITVLDPDTSTTTTPPGVARFWQSVTTGASGNANLSLFPGVNRTPRLYDVAVVPPPGSPYASTCVPKQPILGAEDTPTLVVPLRPVVSGTVSSAERMPVAGVTVTASRKPELAKICASTEPTAFTTATAPTSFATTTDKAGFFTLPVDPGSYQLDFVPASGSAAPRFSDYNVVVNGDLGHSVSLPKPYLIEGDVVDAADKPLPDATIRVFEPLCAKTDGCTLAPILLAETQSDKTGHFRAIVALPSGN